MSTVQTQDLPPVPQVMPITNKGDIVTENWGRWFLNLRAKVNTINDLIVAISGASSTIGLFNDLSPLTTDGDILTYQSGNNIRLPIGTVGQVLTVLTATTVGWAAGGGRGSPLTTKGDIYTFSTVNDRLPVGTNGQVLSADSTQATGLAWVTPGTPTLPLTTKGDILGFNTVAARIPVGTNGQVLTADSTSALGVSYQTPSASGTFKDIFNYLMTGTNTNWATHTLRVAIPGNLLYTGTQIRIQIYTDPATTTTTAITGCWIGISAISGQGFPIDFTVTPTPITFAGSASVSIAGKSSVVSDKITFATTINTSLVVTFQFTSGDAATSNVTDPGITSYSKAVATDGATLLTSGYALSTGNIIYLKRLEVLVS